MYVVTGAAGFIGYNFVKFLNKKGITNIVIIDQLNSDQKWKKLINLKFHEFVNYESDTEELKRKLDNYKILGVFHIGANADVLCNDIQLMLSENYECSKFWFSYCQSKKVPLIYASTSAVYGNSLKCIPVIENECPHNIYAMSKLMFDNFFRSYKYLGTHQSKVVGLRLFNVFGWGEEHKGANSSLPKRFFEFSVTKKFIDVFSADISRDYVDVNDVCQIFWHAYSDQIESGIYNLGSGSTISHMKIATFVKKSAIEHGLDYANSDEFITQIEIPKNIVNSFQFYTRAEEIPDWISVVTQGSENKMKYYIHNLFSNIDAGGRL